MWIYCIGCYVGQELTARSFHTGVSIVVFWYKRINRLSEKGLYLLLWELQKFILKNIIVNALVLIWIVTDLSGECQSQIFWWKLQKRSQGENYKEQQGKKCRKSYW